MLDVVFGHHAVRDAAGPSPGPGHGSQDDPVGQLDIMKVEGLKKNAVWHFEYLLYVVGLFLLAVETIDCTRGSANSADNVGYLMRVSTPDEEG